MKGNIGEIMVGPTNKKYFDAPIAIKDAHDLVDIIHSFEIKIVKFRKKLGDMGIAHEYNYLISQNDESCTHEKLRAELDFFH